METFLITGCSTGIGRALAVELAKRGQRVFATARKPDSLRAVAAENLLPLALDVTDPESIEVAVETVMERAGRIDVLVNNAGVHMLTEVLRLELAPFGIAVTEVQPAQVTTEIEDRAAAGLEEYRDSSYAPYFDSVQRRVSTAKTSPMAAADYASFVADQLLAKEPPRVIRGGGRSAALQTAARLPGPLRDAILRREFGLPGRRS